MSDTHLEPHHGDVSSQLNWLRAAVLGANDGITSVASIIAGVAGAVTDARTILIAGVAGLMAGAFSMAAGEYVSVSSQRDTELALIEKERSELRDMPDVELEELTTIYEGKGLSRSTAEVVAKELTAHDALRAHLEAELHIDQQELTSPWQAALASFISFMVGGAVPLAAVILPSEAMRLPVTFIAVVIALAITGVLSAWMSGSSYFKVSLRVVLGGVVAMAFTYGVGRLFGVAGL
jgi:vacuolar iron transporter family protein